MVMIHHITLGNTSEERRKALFPLIRSGVITLGGYKKAGIYGLLSCASGRQMKVAHRIFFSDEQEAVRAGYRPCGHCLPRQHKLWKAGLPWMEEGCGTFKISNMQAPVNLLPADGEVYFYPAFFSAGEQDILFETLVTSIAWKQEPVRIMGREIMQPRLTAWYGDRGKSYSYTGITMHPQEWAPALLEIKARVTAVTGHTFNSALLNFYRDGNDSMGWHQDNEKELGANPVIASLSFGAERNFLLKHAKDKNLREKILLTPGSLLLMKGTTQHHWYHSIPKTTKVTTGRINITFRTIVG